MDPKTFLYGWLGKKKIGVPTYNVSTVNRGNVQRFKCEVRVPGHGYVGLGNSLNKKDASTNAAMDFCNYLVRQGIMPQEDMPVLKASSLEATTVNGGCNSFTDSGNDSGNGTFFNSSIDDVKSFQDISSGDYPGTGPRLPPPIRQQTSHEKYVTQKADEISQSESVDLKAEIHGGWTMDNSKAALNEFLQKTKQQPINYNFQLKESNLIKTFFCEATVYVPQLGKNITGRGQASTKKVSESMCAMTMVRQLFHLQIIAEFKGAAKKTTASNLPEIPVIIGADIMNRVRKLVTESGVQPATFDESSVTPTEPRSLLLDCKLTQFPESEVYPPGNISWAPVMQNWNPWRASNIDEPPLAFMSLADISVRIAEKEAAKTISTEMKRKRMELPVYSFREKIINTVKNNKVTLIKGETGCGKSTQIAQYILESYMEDGRGAEFNACVSQPRRISAISLAERVAAERGEQLGESTGYSVRFESVTPRPYGSIMFSTVGVLLRRMESGLRGVSHVIIDEIHERDVDTDFVLVILREMIREYSDLRIILMSATIDTNLFTEFFGGCPIIEMHGRTFPVKHYFLEDIISMLRFMPPEPEKPRRGYEDVEDDDIKSKNLNLIGMEHGPDVKMAMSRLSEKEISIPVIEAILLDISTRGTSGSVLIFLPGWNDIITIGNHLNAHPEFSDKSKYVILPLHSQLTGGEQRKIFDHFGEGVRKIILSTNIAETSVTIDDVVFVIDSCKVKECIYTSNNNMVCFDTVWAARTNLTQRRGRAGRVQPGFAFHLCSKLRYDALDEHRTAEILRTPLHQVALTIKLLRLGSVGDFLAKAIEPPPYDMVVESEALLQSMGALDRNLELTDLGRILARLPIDPIIGKTLVLAVSLGIGPLMCELAAASSFSSPFVPREKFHTRLNNQQRSFAGKRWSDHVAVLAVNQAYRDASEQGSIAEQNLCNRVSLSNTILKMTSGARRQLSDVLSNQCGFPPDSMFPQRIDPDGPDENLDLLTSLLIVARYPNICYYKGKRKVYTLEQATALISKTSILVPMAGDVVHTPSPLIVFSDKVRTRVISCKELTVVSAIQLIIFGCRKVECIGPELIRLDDMITIRMNVEYAALLTSLRPCIESLLVRSCMNPESVLNASEEDNELRSLLRELSSEDFFAGGGPIKDNLFTDAAQAQPIHNTRGRGRGGYRGRGADSHNNWGFNSAPISATGDAAFNNGRWGGSDRGGYTPGGFNSGGPMRGDHQHGGFRGGRGGYSPYPPRGAPRGRGRNWF